MQGDPLQVSPNDFKFGIKQEVLENNEAGRDEFRIILKKSKY